MNIFKTIDDAYSKDVEIDEEGKVRYTRDFAHGEVIQIPFHMLKLILARDCPTPRYSAKS